MPNDYYRRRVIRDLLCWVFVFTFPKPFDPSFGGSPGAPTPSPDSSRLVRHSVIIIDAGSGRFVRGFPTR
jgi:hypothetical protein